MEPLDPAKSAATLDALGKQVEGARRSLEARLQSNPVKKTVGADAAAAVTTLRATLRHWFDFLQRLDPLFTVVGGDTIPYGPGHQPPGIATFLRERVAGVRTAAPRQARLRLVGAGEGVVRRRRSRRREQRRHRGESDRPRMGSMERAGLTRMIPYTPEELIDTRTKRWPGA